MNLKRLGTFDALILTALIWFLGKFLRYTFPPLFEPLQVGYGVSNAVIGTAFTGFMLAYAIMQFPSGVLADRVGAVRVIAVGIAIAGIGALVLVVTSSFIVLLITMLILGGGTGAHKTAAIRLLSRIYPSKTGRALGAHDTFGAFGGVVAPAAIVLFLSAPPVFSIWLDWLPGADWRGLFFVSGVCALLLAIIFLLRIPDRLPEDTDTGVPDNTSTPGAHDYLILFTDRRFSAFVLVTIVYSFAYNGVVAFLPLYLSQVAGLETATASLLYSVLFAATFIQLLSGDVSDRVGRLPVMVITLGFATGALMGIIFLFESGPITLGVLVLALGLGAHGYRPVRGAYFMQILPVEVAGGGLGVVRTLLMGFGALSPVIVGLIADIAGFRASFSLLAVALTLAALGVVGLWLTE